MEVAPWIGPAIVAAVISATVTGLGWFVSERQTVRREAVKRRERVADVQAAILAEVRASQFRIGDIRSQAAEIYRCLREDPDYTPFVPRQPEPFVFEATISDLHLLPTAVIDPVVTYYQQVGAVSCLINDMRSTEYVALPQDRKRNVYHDYTALLLHQDILARIAIEALSQSLNIPVEGGLDQRSGEAPGSASERSS